MDSKERVLFLCTGNSCRSQMGEGLLRSMAGDRFDVVSAGVNPSGTIHPMAIKAMDEIGIDISNQKSTDLAEYLGKVNIRWAIIVCDKANQSCPRMWPMLVEDGKLYWPFDDPAEAAGTEEEKMAFFRRVRDEIKDSLEKWLAELD